MVSAKTPSAGHRQARPRCPAPTARRVRRARARLALTVRRSQIRPRAPSSAQALRSCPVLSLSSPPNAPWVPGAYRREGRSSAGCIRGNGPATRQSRRCAKVRGAMIDDVQKELVSAIAKAHDALKRELSKLRAGRATLAARRHPVDYYGTPTALAQMAHINIPEPRLITVKPWDKTADEGGREGPPRERPRAQPAGRWRHHPRPASPADRGAPARSS